jgi:prevent-host-death family protein
VQPAIVPTGGCGVAPIRSGASFGTLSAGMCRVADMALEFSLPQARHHLDELVARAHQDHERIVLTKHGKPTAVLISVAELDELQHAQDRADIALCEAIKAKNEAGLPHEEFMAALDAEDPGQPSG